MLTPYIPLTPDEKYFGKLLELKPIPDTVPAVIAPAVEVVVSPSLIPAVKLDQPLFEEEKAKEYGNSIWWLAGVVTVAVITIYVGEHYNKKREEKKQNAVKPVDNVNTVIINKNLAHPPSR